MSESCSVYLIVSDAPPPAWSDINLRANMSMCKIGVSRSVRGRLTTLQTASPYRLCIWDEWELRSRSQAEKLEKSLHEACSCYHATGEWFFADPSFLKYIVDDVLCVEAVESWEMTPHDVVEYFTSRGYQNDHARDIVTANFTLETAA